MGGRRCRQVIHGHPCFGGGAYHTHGRIHLPVAPRCNIGCNYCVRRHHCANENRPGVTSKVLSPRRALERARAILPDHPQIRVVGIAGPGDPLANEQTFETLRLIHDQFPHLIKCVSTNGLLLSDKLEALLQADVTSVTVTVNSVDTSISELIYAWVRYGESTATGKEAAEILCAKQLEGIERALISGMAVRLNAVLIPEINRDHMPQLARTVAQLGVGLMNIIPLIPQGRFSHLRAPTEEELRTVRDECASFIPQFRGCRQCRADAVGMLTESRPV